MTIAKIKKIELEQCVIFHKNIFKECLGHGQEPRGILQIEGTKKIFSWGGGGGEAKHAKDQDQSNFLYDLMYIFEMIWGLKPPKPLCFRGFWAWVDITTTREITNGRMLPVGATQIVKLFA